MACRVDEDCGEGNSCSVDPRSGLTLCLSGCAAGCRSGYACRGLRGQRACRPEPDGPSIDVSASMAVVGVNCVAALRGSFGIDFDVPSGSARAQLLVFTGDGASVHVQTLRRPNGSQVDLLEGGLGVAPQLYGSVVALVLPDDVGSPLIEGLYRLELEASSDRLCWSLQASPAPAGRLDVLIYSALEGLNGSAVPQDPDYQVMVQELVSLFRRADLEIRIVGTRGLAVPERQPSSRAEASALLARTEPPPPSQGGSNVLNVVLVDELAIDGADVDGFSPSIPGSAGLHGSGASGVVVRGDVIRLKVDGDPAGARLVGVRIAHHVGHYLGLAHTTEPNDVERDPLSDTPGCPDRDRECPDQTNLMFHDVNLGTRELTADQRAVLRGHPLVR